MKTTINIFLISFLFSTVCSQNIIDYVTVDADTIDFSKKQTFKIRGNSQIGFNYSYLLYIPENSIHNQHPRLMVEPNNSGGSSDDFNFHLKRAKQTLRRNIKIVDSLNIPYLVPVFPRPRTNSKIYTHALDRDAMLVPKGDSMHRIDLQLIAMINHARELLSNNGFTINPSIFMMGFSATGNFTNRFAALHPEKVRAVASGAVNGMPIIPVKKLASDLLIYPVGIGDIDSLLDINFKWSSYSKVSQFIYMGSFDRNDTYEGAQCFDDDERELIKKHLGRTMMPDRWNKSQEIINAMNLPIQLVIYNGITHKLTKEIKHDIISFFLANNQEECVKIETYQYPDVEYNYITNAHINKIYFPGDTTLPDRNRDLHGYHFALGIEEYYTNQDYRQLKEFLNNAGFNFRIKGKNLTINVTMENQRGTSSTGDGKLQFFYVKLDQEDFEKIKTGVPYKLVPINKNKDFIWTVNEDVEFIKPKNN